MTSNNDLQEVSVFAPATVSNVNCGYDVMGFALSAPGDEIIARRTDKSGLRIVKITGENGLLPQSVQKNTAGVAVEKLINSIGFEGGLELEVHKKMPLSSGLGSSAASSVGALVAVNRLLGSPCKRENLLAFAAEGEKVACGSAHLDNVAPSLLGGFVLVRSQQPPDVVTINGPKSLFVTVVHPHIEINTKDMRDMLPGEIPMGKAVQQWGNVGGLVAGLMKGDYGLIARSLQDVVVEPIRSKLLPGFDEVKQAAMNAGALGSGISGSGPSMFALSSDEGTAKKAGKAMGEVFKAIGLENDVYQSQINEQGPKILQEQ